MTYEEKVVLELGRIRFRVGVCALIMALPFLAGGAVLLVLLLGMMAR